MNTPLLEEGVKQRSTKAGEAQEGEDAYRLLGAGDGRSSGW